MTETKSFTLATVYLWCRKSRRHVWRVWATGDERHCAAMLADLRLRRPDVCVEACIQAADPNSVRRTGRKA